MSVYEWAWSAVVVGICIADYIVWRCVGVEATLTHLIRRVFAFDASGRQKRLWRVRRACGLLILAVLVVHLASESSGWLVL